MESREIGRNDTGWKGQKSKIKSHLEKEKILRPLKKKKTLKGFFFPRNQLSGLMLVAYLPPFCVIYQLKVKSARPGFVSFSSAVASQLRTMETLHF